MSQEIEVRKLSIFSSSDEALTEMFEGADDDANADEIGETFLALPPSIYEEMGAPDNIELRVLRNEKNEIVSIILNKIESMEKASNAR